MSRCSIQYGEDLWTEKAKRDVCSDDKSVHPHVCSRNIELSPSSIPRDTHSIVVILELLSWMSKWAELAVVKHVLDQRLVQCVLASCSSTIPFNRLVNLTVLYLLLQSWVQQSSHRPITAAISQNGDATSFANREPCPIAMPSPARHQTYAVTVYGVRGGQLADLTARDVAKHWQPLPCFLNHAPWALIALDSKSPTSCLCWPVKTARL